jgi:hypothetical protein
MALTATSAFAVKTHPYTGTSFGPDGAAGSATFNNLQGVAFDQVAGDVYAYDAGAGKVYKFDSAGAPVNFSGLTGNVIEGVGGGGGNGEFEIAVAPAGSPGGTAGDIYVANNSVVKIYAPSGAELGQLTGGETCGVATSPSGHVFVGIYPNEIREYVPSANPATNADQSAASTAELAEICNVAADGLGNVFAANFYGGSSVVKLEGLSDPIAAPVDPGAPTLAIDPSNNDLYANRGGVVAQHDSAGNLLSVFGSEQLSGSRGIAVNGAAQKTYAASSRKHRTGHRYRGDQRDPQWHGQPRQPPRQRLQIRIRDDHRLRQHQTLRRRHSHRRQRSSRQRRADRSQSQHDLPLPDRRCQRQWEQQRRRSVLHHESAVGHQRCDGSQRHQSDPQWHRLARRRSGERMLLRIRRRLRLRQNRPLCRRDPH